MNWNWSAGRLLEPLNYHFIVSCYRLKAHRFCAEHARRSIAAKGELRAAPREVLNFSGFARGVAAVLVLDFRRNEKEPLISRRY